MQNAVVVDSGPLLALFDRDDAHHTRVKDILRENAGIVLYTTWPVLTETAALLDSRVGKETEIEFLEWVIAGGVTVQQLGYPELGAMIALIRKYRDLPFDFADASVAELAASMDVNRILSVDSDFGVYRTADGKPLRNVLSIPSGRRSRW